MHRGHSHEDREHPEGMKKLYRSRKDRIIAGVCSGLAKYFGIDPMIMRLIFVLLFFAQGIGFLIYLILWIITPSESYSGPNAKDAAEEKMSENGHSISENIPKKEWHSERRTIVGAILVLIGFVALINYHFPIMAWVKWSLIWPVVLIIIGAIIMFGNKRY